MVPKEIWAIGASVALEANPDPWQVDRPAPLYHIFSVMLLYTSCEMCLLMFFFLCDVDLQGDPGLQGAKGTKGDPVSNGPIP